jgi:ribosome-binding factor A
MKKKTKQMTQSAQSYASDLKLKETQIAKQKDNFIKALRQSDGNISNALKSSNLMRKTAYWHFSFDSEFADPWHNAKENVDSKDITFS